MTAFLKHKECHFLSRQIKEGCHSRVHLLVLKLGSKVIERGALDLVSILWRHRDWFWSWCGERVSRVRVCGFCKGGGRWAAVVSWPHRWPELQLLPCPPILPGGQWRPADGRQPARHWSRCKEGPQPHWSNCPITSHCRVSCIPSCPHTAIHLESRPTANFCF